MPESTKTFYDALGVPRDAKVTDIVRAYKRICAEQQKEDAAPDARRLALAKVAHDTLTDPQRRDEYDEHLGDSRKRRLKRAELAIGLGVAVAIGVAYASYAWHSSKTAVATVAPGELVQAAASQVGRVQMALMSGEVRDLGVAVGIGENQMATTCRGFVPGAQLSVKVGGFATKADVLHADPDLDVCTLTVKGAKPGIKLRQGVPGAHEKVVALVVGATGLAKETEGSVARLVDDAKGPLVELAFPAPLANGTPVFDSQGRLAAIVTAAEAGGGKPIMSVPGSRIVAALGAAAAAAPPAPATVRAAPPVAQEAPAAEPKARRRSIEEERRRGLEEEEKAAGL